MQRIPTSRSVRFEAHKSGQAKTLFKYEYEYI